MKEYLGLGVVFKAVDQGLSKLAKKTANEVSDLNTKLAKTKKTADNDGKKGGILNSLHESMKLLSISQIGSTLQEIQESIQGTGSSISDTFKKLDTLQTKLTFTFDQTQAQNLNSALTKSMQTYGLIGDEIENIAQGMVSFGRSADEIQTSLPMIGTLVGKLGLDSQKVADMYGQGLASLRATPKAIDGVIKEVVAIQKAYKLTDQVSQLPEIFEAVTRNSAMFGKVNAQTALNTVRSISGLSAVFQKVGMSQQGALKAATGFADKLSSLKRSVSDMRAGLDPLDQDLYEAARTLTMMGVSGEDAFDKIFKGADDPMKLAQDLNKQFVGLSQQQQDIVSARFRRVFGDEATNLLMSYSDKAKEAFAIDKKKPEKVRKDENEKIFADLTKSMGDTFAVQEKLTESSKQYFELVTQFANKNDAIKALKAQKSAWDSLTESVTSGDSILGEVIKKLTLFKDFGLGGILPVLAPLGVFATLLSSLIFPLAGLVGILKLLKIPLIMFQKVFGFIEGLNAAGIIKPMHRLRQLMGVIAGIAEHLYVTFGYRFLKLLDLVRAKMALLASMGFKGTLLKSIELLKSGMALLVRVGITPLIAGIRALALTVAMTPLGPLIAGVVALGAALAAIVYYWDDIKLAASKAFDWLKNGLSELSNKVMDTIGLGDIWTDFKNKFAVALTDISKLWEQFKTYITSFGIGGLLKEAGNALGLTSTETKQVATESLSSVKPMAQQAGVVSSPTFTDYSDVARETSSDPNIQALINEVGKLQELLARVGDAIVNRPTLVQIEGDVKKFFKAVSQEQKNQLGNRMAGGAF